MIITKRIMTILGEEKTKRKVMDYIWHFEKLGFSVYTNLTLVNHMLCEDYEGKNDDTNTLIHNISRMVRKSGMVLLAFEKEVPDYVVNIITGMERRGCISEKRLITDNDLLIFNIIGGKSLTSYKSDTRLDISSDRFIFYSIEVIPNMLLLSSEGSLEVSDLYTTYWRDNGLCVFLRWIDEISIDTKLRKYGTILICNKPEDDQNPDFIKKVKAIANENDDTMLVHTTDALTTKSCKRCINIKVEEDKDGMSQCRIETVVREYFKIVKGE